MIKNYQKENTNKSLSIEKIRIDYAGVTPDFDKKTLSMKMHGEISFKSELDSEKLKTELLGKNEDEVENIIKKYPRINNVTFEFEPKFVSRVPQYAKRVSIEVKTEK